MKLLLNTSHSKILTGISLSKYLETKLALIQGNEVVIEEKASAVSPIDDKTEFELLAKDFGMEYKMYNKAIDDNALGALTSVADLIIFDRNELSKFHDHGILTAFLKMISCPVMIIPENAKFENLLMVHDGGHPSVQAVKHFITIFNPDLRTLPVSVLTSDPKSKRDIENEKVFIDYVKLFFNDIGIQLMSDKPLKSIVRNIEHASNNSMIVVSEECGMEILNCNSKNRALFKDSPIFIFKNTSI